MRQRRDFAIAVGQPMMRVLFAAAAVFLLIASASADPITSARASRGLPAMHRSGELAAIASQQAYAMASTGRRCSMAALWHNTDSSVTRAENVACGCSTEACVIARWLRSPGHRANIMARWAGRYGIASARSSSGAIFWAMEIRP